MEISWVVFELIPLYGEIFTYRSLVSYSWKPFQTRWDLGGTSSVLHATAVLVEETATQDETQCNSKLGLLCHRMAWILTTYSLANYSARHSETVSCFIRIPAREQWARFTYRILNLWAIVWAKFRGMSGSSYYISSYFQGKFLISIADVNRVWFFAKTIKCPGLDVNRAQCVS